MALSPEFSQAADAVKSLKSRPSNDELLELYALFKQAAEGDVSGARPGILDVKGRKKYDAWAAKKGLTSDKAQAAYVSLVRRLESTYGK